uniref:NADH dehydrogenase subunit 6 n=1 Tax=Gumaga orientalis TaxID=2566641 RepID=UPI0022DCDE30|nr:NADH dehydrogenase subunit 6 [Gumaga orientalis]UZZ43984.1 NADH dehydrogenase subunit 6 [Gumaga orientalis]
MIMKIMYSILIFFTTMNLQIYQPLTMVMNLILISLLICMMLGTMNKSFWFSFIMFLIFIGGLLILFIYISSLNSNKFYQFNFKKMLFMMIMIMLMMLTIMIMKNYHMQIFDNIEINKFNSYFWMLNYEYENNNELNKLYNKNSMMISVMLMNYLLFVLIVCVKITNFYYGPLRKNY